MESLVGRSLGRYEIRLLLGEGGMGAVFKAFDATLQRDVAIKVMHPHLARQPDFHERFLLEARTAARLDHPGVVPVHDFGQDGPYLFIVMKFIPGDDLHQLLKDLHAAGSWVLPSEAVQIVRQISLALDYVHRQGVLHRDIKPGNIMLEPEPTAGLPYHPILTDLGLAKLLEGQPITRDGASLGTPAYMSPEQALGRPTDARSDVYSLGVLLYELAVGQLPFPARTITEAIRYHTKEPPPPPRSLNPQLPEPLEDVILKALEKNPDQRFPTAAMLAQALEGISTGAEAAVVSGPRESEVSLVTQYQKSLAKPQPEERATSLYPSTLFCPSCGARNRAGDRFCAGCGATLPLPEEIPASAPPSPPPPQTRPPGRRRPGWVWAMVGAVGVALVAGLVLLVGPMLWGGSGGTPSERPTGTVRQAETTEPASTPTYPLPTTPTAVIPEIPPTTAPAPLPTSGPTAVPTVPSATPIPTTPPTPTCPPVSGPFSTVWQAQQDALGCATDDAANQQLAKEQMERGLMIWRSGDDTILVLYDSGDWARYPDIWNEGDPEYYCPEIAPSECPPTPRRGFGKIWCTYANVRDGLGWATEYEDEFYGPVQSFQRGFLLRNDESGEIYMFLSSGSWTRY